MKLFYICTIANNLAMYEAMKSSFIKAGFDEDRCRYSLFDNSRVNIYEPYSTFNTIHQNPVEPYIIFCHQDVLLNQGHGFGQLVKVLEELDQLDPDWAVVGNAGSNNNYDIVRRITDPNCAQQWVDRFPERVHSLDENFLLVKSSAKIACSPELKGFHFYATDLCLNAMLKGYSCYVIDFHLTHLSAGDQNQHFRNSQAMFRRRWNCEFKFCYVQTPCTIMFLSKYRMLRQIFDHNILTYCNNFYRSIRAVERVFGRNFLTLVSPSAQLARKLLFFSSNKGIS